MSADVPGNITWQIENSQLPELKILIDAVQSSRFITEKKSKIRIGKLVSLTSEDQCRKAKDDRCISPGG